MLRTSGSGIQTTQFNSLMRMGGWRGGRNLEFLKLKDLRGWLGFSITASHVFTFRSPPLYFLAVNQNS